ncbi:hypothetical protein [Clostridium sp. D53t1_180928_C8]|uniref:hypothetical protein n=1 Tax=Clostridium sp. D53t1_180928_C8 TaxID=2787101 RepID=UPI0018A9DBC1|nr:hypothetical protein [Clostridium sp. D53t1_180928_C8]
MKILTGFAVIKDRGLNRISFTTNEINEDGAIVKSNIKESFFVVDSEIKVLISSLEEKIKERVK